MGVAAALASGRCFRAMARNEHRLVAHGPQALGDAVDELLMVALVEIGAPNVV